MTCQSWEIQLQINKYQNWEKNIRVTFAFSFSLWKFGPAKFFISGCRRGGRVHAGWWCRRCFRIRRCVHTCPALRPSQVADYVIWCKMFHVTESLCHALEKRIVLWLETGPCLHASHSSFVFLLQVLDLMTAWRAASRITHLIHFLWQLGVIDVSLILWIQTLQNQCHDHFLLIQRPYWNDIMFTDF